MSRTAILRTALVLALLTAIQLLTALWGRPYYLTQLTMAAYYAVVVMALCLVMGYAGQVSLGHGAFFAIGGYTSAVLTTRRLALPEGSLRVWLERVGIVGPRIDAYGGEIMTVTPWCAFLTAMLLTLGVALLIGYPALRLKGHYLAMATLGFGLIVYRLVLGSDLTGASDGITGVPAWQILPGLHLSGRRMYRVQNFYLAWAITLSVLALLLNLVRSRVGRALRAIHESEAAAAAVGIDTAAYKLKAFVLSAVITAAAGSLLTHYNGGIGPSEASALKSVRHVALVAAGGMANLWGALVVSTAINFLSLRGCFGTLDHALFGAMLIAIISLAPDGPLKPAGAWCGKAGRWILKRLRGAHAAA